MQGIAAGDLRLDLVPGFRDQETFVHSIDHPLKLLHRDGKGQDIHRNTGTRRRIEHPEHGTGVITLLFEPGIVDD